MNKKEPSDMVLEQKEDRAFFNCSYMMMMMSSHLGDWVNNHSLNDDLSSDEKLTLVTQIESSDITDTYLTLTYGKGENERSIYAGYVGQKLTQKELELVKSLPTHVMTDLVKRPPKETILNSRLGKLDNRSGYLDAVSSALSNFLIATVGYCDRLTFQLAVADGSTHLFFNDGTGLPVKITFFINDVNKFINEKIDQRVSLKRDAIAKLIQKGEKQ